MPEGDTIHRAANRLRPALEGATLVRFEASRLAGAMPRPGTTVTAVEARGKYLLVRFADGWELQTHLRMTGRWDLYRTGERWRKPAHLARAIIEVDGWVAVCSSAPVVRLVRIEPTDRAADAAGGPDGAGRGSTAAAAKARSSEWGWIDATAVRPAADPVDAPEIVRHADADVETDVSTETGVDTAAGTERNRSAAGAAGDTGASASGGRAGDGLRSHRDQRFAGLTHLGPDLCRADVDLDVALARMASIPPPDAGIADVLLDQRVAAGIGNVYKSEVLWACRLHPLTPVGQVDDDLRRALLETAAGQLQANLTTSRRTTVAGPPGSLAVYGRGRRPCRRCGTPIRWQRTGRDHRSTYWCPRCQPAPDPPVDDGVSPPTAPPD